MMQAVTAIAAPDRSLSSDPILDHVVDCDTCLSVIVDLDLPTAACETRCRRLRELLSGAAHGRIGCLPYMELDSSRSNKAVRRD